MHLPSVFDSFQRTQTSVAQTVAALIAIARAAAQNQIISDEQEGSDARSGRTRVVIPSGRTDGVVAFELVELRTGKTFERYRSGPAVGSGRHGCKNGYHGRGHRCSRQGSSTTGWRLVGRSRAR